MKKQYLFPSIHIVMMEYQETLLSLSSREIGYGGKSSNSGITSSDIKEREEEEFIEYIISTQQDEKKNSLW